MQQCPCGTKKNYIDCCGVFLSGQKTPSTPEELMRSRYTAYHQLDLNYIRGTMQPPAADHFNEELSRSWAKDNRWIGLNVINSSMKGTTGTVEFIAHYSCDNKKNILHEISEFHFEDGRWFYTDGTLISDSQKKLGRNDMCLCGSLKKYKKCCGT